MQNITLCTFYCTYSKPTSPGKDPSRIFGHAAKGRALLIFGSAFKAVATLEGLVIGANAAADVIREAQIRVDFMILIKFCMV